MIVLCVNIPSLTQVITSVSGVFEVGQVVQQTGVSSVATLIAKSVRGLHINITYICITAHLSCVFGLVLAVHETFRARQHGDATHTHIHTHTYKPHPHTSPPPASLDIKVPLSLFQQREQGSTERLYPLLPL